MSTSYMRKAETIPLDIDIRDEASLDKYIDYSDLVQKFSIPDTLQSVLVVDGLPQFDSSKKEKFVNFFIKLLAKEKFILDPKHVFVPMTNDQSDGFLFLNCPSADIANKILNKMQNAHFDKKNSMIINRFIDIKRYASVPAAWDENEALGPTPTTKPKEFLAEWTLDPTARDQIAIITHKSGLSHDLKLHWAWADSLELVRSKENFSEGNVAWSPFGSLLAARFQLGVSLNGGSSMDRVSRVVHPRVESFCFSPRETFLVTFSPAPLPPPAADRHWTQDSVGHHILIWKVSTGRLMRSFSLNPMNLADSEKVYPWPYFKWSPDEKYFTAVHSKTNRLVVYESQKMTQVSKEYFSKVNNVTSFEWMPINSENQKKKPNDLTHCLAFFIPCQGAEKPASVTLLNVDNLTVIRRAQLFHGISGKVSFNHNGEYMMLRALKTNKSGKIFHSTIEIFHLKEKGVPCDTLEIKNPLCTAEIAPVGNHLGIITWDSPEGAQSSLGPIDQKTTRAGVMNKMNVSFYTIGKPTVSQGATVDSAIKLLSKFERRTVNTLVWSPKGRFAVALGMKNLGGRIEFYDVDNGAKPNEVSKSTHTIHDMEITVTKKVERSTVLFSLEHSGLSAASWDPTGRYLMSISPASKHVPDGKLLIFSFYGKILRHEKISTLTQAIWRPRPPTLLSADQVENTVKSIKSYIKEVESKDKEAAENAKKAERQLKVKKFHDFILMRSLALLDVPAIAVDQKIIE